MELFQAIKKRRSVRQFTNRPVEKAKIRKIIEAAVWAPSACNRQGWKFLILPHGPCLQKLISEGTAHFMNKVPVAILVLYEKATDNTEYKDYLQSAAAAIQNMHLAACSLGLGSCWVANLPPKKRLRQIYNLPSFIEPIALVAIGYPKGKSTPPPRQHSFQEISQYEEFRLSASEQKRLSTAQAQLKARRLARVLYLHLPTPIKNILSPIASKFEKKNFL